MQESVTFRNKVTYAHYITFKTLLSLAIENEASRYTLETILSRIHYFRCYSHIQLIALINTLHQFIAKHSQV